MVALETAARAEPASPRARARLAGSRWWLATGAIVVLGSLAPLAVAPGIGHLSAAVMSVLLGAGVAAIGLALDSPRAAFAGTLGLMLLLDLGRLPPRPAPGYEEPQALWQTDQTIDASLDGATSRLMVLADAEFEGQQAPFGLVATVNGQQHAWRCPFQHGRQWLELPLDGGSSSSLDVRFGLSGAPDRDANYLVVYRSATRDGWLLGPSEDPAAPAPITTCSPA